jgi:hypothetical protein
MNIYGAKGVFMKDTEVVVQKGTPIESLSDSKIAVKPVK